MSKFDPTEPERIVHEAMEHLQSIAISKSQRDFERRFKVLSDNEWLKRLGRLREPFIKAVSKNGNSADRAMDSFDNLFEAARRIHHEAGALVSVFTVVGSRKIDAALGKEGEDLGGQHTVTADDRWMHSYTMNRKLLDDVSEQFFKAVNAVGKLSTRLRPKPSKNGDERGPGRPASADKKLAVKLLADHKKRNPTASKKTRVEWVVLQLTIKKTPMKYSTVYRYD